MARSIIGVIIAWIVMIVLEVAAFMTLYAIMGTNWSFKPHSFQASTRWTLAQFVIIALTGVVAGVVCAVIAKGGRAPLALAVIVLVLGLVGAVAKTTFRAPDKNELRMGSLTQMEAMNKAWHPTWVLFLGPFVGAAGVVIGSKLKRR